MKRRTLTWTVFGACSAAGVALLGWLTVELLRLERSEAHAKATTAHELAVGAALWQMDAWLLPIVGEEAQRAPSDYCAFNPVAQAFTNRFAKLNAGDVITPSPLLGYRSEYFPLHFQVDAKGTITSPQVPEGNALDVAQSQVEDLDLERPRRLLDEIRPWLSTNNLLMVCSMSAANLPEQQLAARSAAAAAPPATKDADTKLQLENYSQRAKSTVHARQVANWAEQWTGTQLDLGARVRNATMVPVWLGPPANAERLVFVRKVELGGEALFQGVVADWAKLAAGMLAAIRDPALAKVARLTPVDAPDIDRHPHLLTVVPAELVSPGPTIGELAWSPTRLLLLIAWIALTATGLAVAFTLHAALAFGDRRARFASAVTHELRTPLTTFKMYSEMLALGMVREPERQQQYLQTLQSESDRLARLVENVLGYARIEDGRFTAQRQELAVDELVSRVLPVLQRRADEAGFALQVDLPAAQARVAVDVDAVSQILFNLIDNACKYGRPPVHLCAEIDGDGVALSIRDAGDGVPSVYRRRIFAAFDRGPRQPGDNEQPGVGLGLALARGLARDLGGDLTLAPRSPGAAFVLLLPRLN